MNISNKLLLSGVLVLLMAGPVYPQNRDILQLQKDMIDLKNQVSQMQSSVDQKNAAMLSLIEKIYDQVNGLSGGVQKITQTFESTSDKNAADLRNLMSTMTTRLNDVSETVSAVRSQLSGLSQQITSMKTTAEPLAGPEESWRAARLDMMLNNYDLALQGLTEFQLKYPNDPHSAEAQILKGEALFALKKYDQAVIEYDTFLQKYPENDNTKSALYKKGLAQVEANDPGALATLRSVTTRYPKTVEAENAAAKIKQLSAPGGARRPGSNQ